MELDVVLNATNEPPVARKNMAIVTIMGTAGRGRPTRHERVDFTA